MVTRLAQPVCLSKFIGFFKTDEPTYYGWIWGVMMIVLMYINAILYHLNSFLTQRDGMRIRIAVCSIMYRKLLKLNHGSLSKISTGELVNLLSNDVQRFDLAFEFLHFIWIAPFYSIAIFYILYLYVGLIPTIAGYIVVLLQAIPLQGFISKLLGKLRFQVAERTDNRIKIMNEITSGMQVIKMYAWEKPFEKVVQQARKIEINTIKKSIFAFAIMWAMGIYTDRIILYLTLIPYVYLGSDLSADTVYFLARLHNELQGVVTIFFPRAFSFSYECISSITRLENFLMLDELQVEQLRDQDSHLFPLGNITLRNATYTWKQMNIVPTILDINLHITPGKLCCVVGKVGSGKSSLLQILLKELPLLNGEMNITGKVSYASQEPWLFASNVKSNILFGKPLLKDRYQEVIKVCCLEQDFKQLPYGDKTLVGERGTSLSGGQKARVSLARAVYADADIYLFDDPLSAVDTNVGKRLFESCIMQYLRGKTRVLVTHQHLFLNKADLIVVMKDGKIEKVAKPSQFTESELNIIQNDTTYTIEKENKLDELKSETFDSIMYESTESIKDCVDNEDPQETDELMEKGIIPTSTYYEFWRFGIGLCCLIFVFLMFVISQIVTNSVDLWVSYWVATEEKGYLTFNSTLDSNATVSYPAEASNKTKSRLFFTFIYSGLLALTVILVTWRNIIFIQVYMKSAKALHNNMFKHILRAPMRFFDTNPSGRILNRFSKDMGVVDELLPRLMIDAIQIALVTCGIFVMVFIVSPWMIIPSLVLIPLYYLLGVIYLKVGHTLKRLEGVANSPIFSHLSASLNGIKTIRSSNAEKMLISEFDSLKDQHTSTFYSFLVSSVALGLYLDLLSSTLTTIISAQFLLFKYDMVSSYVGLVIAQCSILNIMIQFGIRSSAELSSNMISVERILQYTKLDTEGPFESLPTKKAPKNWPDKGQISFKETYLKYAPEQPPVLKNLNFEIKSGQKVGVVGRTGAGKSSLVFALFKLAPIEGSIFIDGINISDIGLNELRMNISIIPQDPVLFSSTVRYNLDPFDKHSDEILWKALENVQLTSVIHNLSQLITKGGSNFSAGQRQLICLARAIVRNNKILVMDEATANVDMQTDTLIQETIRERFKDCTVITIAHRLNTIMDSDRILVMDAGQIIEFDHAFKLLENSKGYFSKMVDETGSTMKETLREMAKNDYEAKKKNIENIP
ncbi:ATP-binding cassette sub-family C member 4-like isoform X2 [Diabrotica undecimpunctata]